MKNIEKYFNHEGLLFLGSIAPSPDPFFVKNYKTYLSSGFQANLHYLENNFSARTNFNEILPDTKTILVFALPYFLGEEKNSQIAQYSQFKDYHKVLKQKGQNILDKMAIENPELLGRVVVDSAPILERALAAQTKDGFIGKNTFFIHKEYGSFLLLGEIFLNIPLPAEEKKVAHESCGECKQCQVHCPTGALNTDYKIDSQKCLSYWTIENRNEIPLKYWPWLKYSYFGCDICQNTCPLNIKLKNKTLPSDIEIKKFPSLYEIAIMNSSQYEKYFGGTPMTRAKRNGLRRNALIAMTVLKDPLLSSAIEISKLDCEHPILTL
jgi:epoxyqueuosine reductase